MMSDPKNKGTLFSSTLKVEEVYVFYELCVQMGMCTSLDNFKLFERQNLIYAEGLVMM